jgi:hypothetical protein
LEDVEEPNTVLLDGMGLTERGRVSGAPLVGVSNLLHNIGHDVLDSGSKNGVKMLFNFLVKYNGIGR